MKIELLKTMTEVGPFAGEVVDYEKAKAVAYVNAGYAKWLPEEEGEPVEEVAAVTVELPPLDGAAAETLAAIAEAVERKAKK